MRYLRLPAVIAATCFLLLPAAAHGQGKRPDPNSPAGFEYQLPLEEARKNAAGGGGDDKPGPAGARRSGDRAAPLFGAGIAATPKGGDGAADGDGGSHTAATGDGAATQSAGAGSTDDAGGRKSGDGSEGPKVAQASLPSADDGGGSPTLWIAGIVLAVLLLGALMGLFLRRGLGQPGS